MRFSFYTTGVTSGPVHPVNEWCKRMDLYRVWVSSVWWIMFLLVAIWDGNQPL